MRRARRGIGFSLAVIGIVLVAWVAVAQQVRPGAGDDLRADAGHVAHRQKESRAGVEVGAGWHGVRFRFGGATGLNAP